MPERKSLGDCNLVFFIELESGSYTNSFGEQSHEVEEIKKIKENYIASTTKALNELGCEALHTPDVNNSDLIIKISRQLQISALPQEWLTGLSFGLIPSWGARPGQFEYQFTNSKTNKSYSYIVDQHSYNHLVLFPVFWVIFFTLDEQKIYARALANFIKST